MGITRVENIHGIFQQFVLEFDESHPSFIQLNARKYVSDKKIKFNGLEYLDQIENNMIYACETTTALIQLTANYMVTGQPSLPGLPQASEFTDNFRRTTVLPKLPFLEDFLKTGRQESLPGRQFERYETLKERRKSDTPAIYLEEIEFCMLHAKASELLIQNFCIHLMCNSHYAGLATRLPFDDVTEALTQRVYMHVNLIIGNVRSASVTNADKAHNKPKWKFWQKSS